MLQPHVVSFKPATIAHVPRKMFNNCCGSPSTGRLHLSNKNPYGRSHEECRHQFVPSSVKGTICATIVNMRNRSSPHIGTKAEETQPSSEDDICYVLPPRFTIVGEALAPLVNNLRDAMAQEAALSGHEFVMPGSIFHHLDAIQRVLERLPLRVDGLVNGIGSSEEPDIAHIFRAAGRLEEVILEWVAGYQEVKASHAQPEACEVRDLLVGVYRHHLLEVCNWLADLVKAIADPAAAMKGSGQQMGEGATLTVSLSVTVPPEMAKLFDIAKRMQIETAPEIEPLPATQRTVQSGPGLLGTMGALAFGIGVTKALLGRHRG